MPLHFSLFLQVMSEPCFSCEQFCCEWTALLWTALFCTCHSLAKAGMPQVSESLQGFPETSNLIILARIKILHTLQQRNVIDKPQYLTCFGSHWSNQDGRLPRTYNLYIVHKCTFYRVFVCLPMRRFLTLKFCWQKSSGWLQLVFFILVLKIGRNR